MTATDLAWAVLAAADVKDADKQQVQILGQGIKKPACGTMLAMASSTSMRVFQRSGD